MNYPRALRSSNLMPRMSQDVSQKQQIKITMPIALFKERKKGKPKRIPICLNWYRNVYFHEANRAKTEYKRIVEEQIQKYWYSKPETPVLTVIKFHSWTKRRYDLDNRTSIQCKFFLDAMVELWYLEDDSYTYVNKIVFEYGWYDRGNARVEITMETNV